VPHSARADVSKQIEQMSEDRILELSDSSFINPLTIVYRENKEPRVCIDARRVNNAMLPDRARVRSIDEMLQQFYRVKYVVSLDLTSAFLQILSNTSSRKGHGESYPIPAYHETVFNLYPANVENMVSS